MLNLALLIDQAYIRKSFWILRYGTFGVPLASNSRPVRKQEPAYFFSDQILTEDSFEFPATPPFSTMLQQVSRSVSGKYYYQFNWFIRHKYTLTYPELQSIFFWNWITSRIASFRQNMNTICRPHAWNNACNNYRAYQKHYFCTTTYY